MATSCGEITVVSEFAAGNVSVESCSLASSSLEPGAGASVSVRVQNSNTQPTSATVVVTLDGEMVTSGSVTVSANSSAQTTLSFSAPSSPGTYNVGVELSDVAQNAPHGARSRRAFAGFSLFRGPGTLGCASCGSSSGSGEW